MHVDPRPQWWDLWCRGPGFFAHRRGFLCPATPAPPPTINRAGRAGRGRATLPCIVYAVARHRVAASVCFGIQQAGRRQRQQDIGMGLTFHLLNASLCHLPTPRCQDPPTPHLHTLHHTFEPDTFGPHITLHSCPWTTYLGHRALPFYHTCLLPYIPRMPLPFAILLPHAPHATHCTHTTHLCAPHTHTLRTHAHIVNSFIYTPFMLHTPHTRLRFTQDTHTHAPCPHTPHCTPPSHTHTTHTRSHTRFGSFVLHMDYGDSWPVGLP